VWQTVSNQHIITHAAAAAGTRETDTMPAPKVTPENLQRSATRATFVSGGFKGGEGTLLLNTAPHGYWKETLVAWSGRPLPPLIMSLVYLLFVAVVTVVSEVVMPRVGGSLAVDGVTTSSVGGCLFFLLVFRSNASYDRWWEGRKKWGMVINRTRDLARQSICYMGRSSVHVDPMVRHIIAFAVTMKRHLRGERELTELSTKEVLSHDQIVEIQSAKHMPLLVLERLSSTICAAKRAGELSDIEAMALDANLTQYEDDLGACERILKTKMPFAYIIHLRFFLVIWLLTLPFALVDKVGWGTIPVSMAIHFALVGLEMIGVEIENPFGHDYNDLPLDSITDDTITANLLELLQRHEKNSNPMDKAS
jgi:putative membrane protein